MTRKFFSIVFALTLTSVSMFQLAAAKEEAPEVEQFRSSVDSLAQTFCDSFMDGKFEVFFSLPHPDLVADYMKLLQVTDPGMTIESMVAEMKEQSTQMTMESCKVLETDTYECVGDESGYVSPITDGLSFVYDECGKAKIEMTVKDMGASAQDASFVNIDGQWYLDLGREIFEEMSIGGAGNFFEYAHYLCDGIYASGETWMTDQFLSDFMALALIKAGESDDDETAHAYVVEIIADLFNSDEGIESCSVTQREAADCSDVMMQVGSEGLDLFVTNGVSAKSAQASADDLGVSYCGTMRLDYETDSGKEVSANVMVGYYGMWGIIGFEPLD